MATLAQKIAGDYAYLDGVETVTLTPQNPTATPVTGVKALRRVRSMREISLGVAVGLEPSDVPFHLWLGPSSAPSTVPKNGDLVTDSANVVWTIMSIDYSPLTSRYRAVCRKQV